MNFEVIIVGRKILHEFIPAYFTEARDTENIKMVKTTCKLFACYLILVVFLFVGIRADKDGNSSTETIGGNSHSLEVDAVGSIVDKSFVDQTKVKRTKKDDNGDPSGDADDSSGNADDPSGNFANSQGNGNNPPPRVANSNLKVDNKHKQKEKDRELYRYVLTSKDDRDEEILKAPIHRPFTTVHENRSRSLHPVRIKPGENFCVYSKFRYFFNEVEERNMTAYELLMNATVTIRNQDYYFYDPEDLCIAIDDELNIDIWKYDCSLSEVCVCGIYFGYVDIDIAPQIEDHLVRYLQVNGLDRKLIVEEGECRSGLGGHCSFPISNVTIPTRLECSKQFDCVPDDVFGPVITNEETKQVYGICQPKYMTRFLEPEPASDLFDSATILSRQGVPLAVSVMTLAITMIL